MFIDSTREFRSTLSLATSRIGFLVDMFHVPTRSGLQFVPLQTLQRVRYVDTMLKMEMWCRSTIEPFVWMMDDQVFIRPFGRDFFDTRLFQEPIEKPVRPWEKLFP